MRADVACPKTCDTCPPPRPTPAPTTPWPTPAPTRSPTYAPTPTPTPEPSYEPSVSPAPTFEPTATRFTVSCAGDSITAGDDGDDYPGRLARLLRDADPFSERGYDVKNFGRSGTTVTDTSRDYRDSSQYDKLLRAPTDVAVLMFGTNDAKLDNVKKTRKTYVSAYRELIADVRGARDPAPVVLVGIPVRYGNAGFADQWGDDASFINDELPAMLEELEGDVDGFVPFDLALTDESHYDDPIHPNSAGFARMAAIAADVVLRWRTRAPTVSPSTSSPTRQRPPTRAPTTAVPSTARPSAAPTATPKPSTAAPSGRPTPAPTLDCDRANVVALARDGALWAAMVERAELAALLEDGETLLWSEDGGSAYGGRDAVSVCRPGDARRLELRVEMLPEFSDASLALTVNGATLAVSAGAYALTVADDGAVVATPAPSGAPTATFAPTPAPQIPSSKKKNGGDATTAGLYVGLALAIAFFVVAVIAALHVYGCLARARRFVPTRARPRGAESPPPPPPPSSTPPRRFVVDDDLLLYDVIEEEGPDGEGPVLSPVDDVEGVPVFQL